MSIERVAKIEASLEQMVRSVDASTTAMNQLSSSFAAYAAKHDRIEVDMTEVKTDIRKIRDQVSKNSQDLAAAKPTLDGINGIVWRIVTGCLFASGGAAALVAALSKL